MTTSLLPPAPRFSSSMRTVSPSSMSLVADHAALFSKDGRDVAGPRVTSCWRGLDLLALGGEHGGAVWHLVTLELATLGVDDDELAVALQRG